jgi:outer membrane lipoprotein carrier protein
MRLLAFAAALSVAAHATAASLPAQGVDVTIDRAVAAYAKMKTARATFEQTLTNPLTGSTVVARGEYQQQAPNRLSVRFTDPAGDRIVSDGKVLWAYLPSSNPGQAMKMPLGEEGAGSVDLAGQFLTEPRSKYTITAAGTATVSGRATHALNLVPKQPTQFTKATVWVDDKDGSVRQFEVTDANGLTRRVRILSLSVNVPVDRDAFTFTPPKGVKVFDQAAMMGST